MSDDAAPRVNAADLAFALIEEAVRDPDTTLRAVAELCAFALAAGTGTDPRWQQLRRVIRTRWSHRSSRRFRIMVIEAQRELAARGDVAPAFVRYRDRTAALREKLAALLPDENPADEVAGA